MSKQPAKPKQIVECHRSERYVIAVKTASHHNKVFQIIFKKNDGSLFVNFPYYKHSEGIVSLMTWTPENPPPANLSLEPGGKITSHLVKYSHHPNGRAHFSQDGKVFTGIKKQSVPIKEVEGHEFTIQLQGLGSFQKLEPENEISPPSAKRTILKFSFGTEEPEAIKFVGFWYSQQAISKRLTSGVLGKIMTLNSPNGKVYRAFICSAPPGHADDERILALSCEAVPRLDKDEETALTFIGGFDRPEIVNNLTETTSFLALSYPVVNPDELITKIGSIDFVERANK
jgi:hypothetical protein